MRYEKGLVSVIFASYNHEQYIEETIKALINQTYRNIEIIVIDDGSIDNSREIINRYEERLRERFVNTHIIFQENKGICRTINRGLLLARGEFYSLAASDDIWFPNFIKKHVEYLNKNQDFVCSYSDGINIETEDIVNKKYENGILFSDIFKFKAGNLSKYLLKDENIIKIPSIAFVYRTEYIEELGFYDENLLFEDVDMFFKISRKFEIGMIEQVLCLHRLHKYNTGRNPKVITKGMTQLFYKYKRISEFSKETEFLDFLSGYRDIEMRNKILENIENLSYIKNKKVIIWGASGGGRQLLKEKPQLPIEFFVDSKSENKYIQKYKVQNPAFLKGKSDQYYIIIAASPKNYFKIRVELELFGYSFINDYC